VARTVDESGQPPVARTVDEPDGPPVARRVDLPADPAAREAAAMMDLERVKVQQEAAEERSSGPPEEAWKWLPGLLGMPVEMSSRPLAHRPLITWGLGGLLVLVFVLTVQNLAAVVGEFGFVPAQWHRHGGLTVLASFFLHGGLFHLIGNLYFFLIFGDNVEDHLGPAKFIILVLGAHLAGTALHGAFDPRPEIPVVGASAGIFGVVAFYAIAFPRSRLGLLFFYFWWIRLPAWVLLVFYGGMQLLGAMVQVQGAGHVSNLGHLGGMAVGILAALFWRSAQNREPPDAREERDARDFRDPRDPGTRGYSKSERRNW
jgi:membrane associated rhomboid family serine protease